MPFTTYKDSTERPGPKYTQDHVTNALMNFARNIVDWDQVEITPNPNFPGLMHYQLKPEYKERITLLDSFIGPLDLYKPIVFFSKIDITRDLAYILLTRYFLHVAQAKGENEKARYIQGFDCKSLTFIQDVYNKNRGSENITGPADVTYSTEQDLISEAFFWYGNCTNTGFNWSGPFESFMEGRTGPVPMSPSITYPLVTWGLLIGTRSDAANNTSEKGMPRLLSYLENKQNTADWLVVDLNPRTGYEKLTQFLKESSMPKSGTTKVPDVFKADPVIRVPEFTPVSGNMGADRVNSEIY